MQTAESLALCKVRGANAGSRRRGPGVGGGIPYSCLYGEAPPERSTFLQVYKRIGILSMLYKINQGHCPAYFNKYIEHISNTHNYNTRSVSNNNITTPACKRNSGLRTFHSSACRLWNALDPEPKTLSHTNFKNYLFKLYRSMISFLDLFKICKTFKFH